MAPIKKMLRWNYCPHESQVQTPFERKTFKSLSIRSAYLTSSSLTYIEGNHEDRGLTLGSFLYADWARDHADGVSQGSISGLVVPIVQRLIAIL